jgi:hypothetical protein
MEMSYIVDFKKVSTVGLESSPVADVLAGLRANEARYFMNKYKHEFTVVPASESQETIDYVKRILKEERNIEFVRPWGRFPWSLVHKNEAREPSPVLPFIKNQCSLCLDVILHDCLD